MAWQTPVKFRNFMACKLL